MSTSLLKAERVHELKTVEGGTEVRNWEAQTGWLVYVVRLMYGQRLRDNFQLWVDDLRKFVEGVGMADGMRNDQVDEVVQGEGST
jgi:hypothetical protein